MVERLTKLIADKSAILTLVSTIVVFLILYVAFMETPSYDVVRNQIGAFLEIIWTGLVAVANLAHYLVRNFRNKILFRNGSPAVSANRGPKVLLWILDGCNIQAFLDVAQRNKNLEAIFEEGYFAQCVSIFPSVTPAAHSSIIAGCYPSKTRVPAFDWVEVKTDFSGNETREYIRCMPDYKRFREQGSKREFQKQFFKGLGDALDLNRRLLSPLVYTILRH